MPLANPGPTAPQDGYPPRHVLPPALQSLDPALRYPPRAGGCYCPPWTQEHGDGAASHGRHGQDHWWVFYLKRVLSKLYSFLKVLVSRKCGGCIVFVFPSHCRIFFSKIDMQLWFKFFHSPSFWDFCLLPNCSHKMFTRINNSISVMLMIYFYQLGKIYFYYCSKIKPTWRNS